MCFKDDKSNAGIQLPEKYFGKRTAKATGIPPCTIARVFNKWVFKGVHISSVYTPDKNRS